MLNLFKPVKTGYNSPDNNRFLRAGDEAKSELCVAVERDAPRLGDLLGLDCAPLSRVLVRRRFVEMAGKKI